MQVKDLQQQLAQAKDDYRGALVMIQTLSCKLADTLQKASKPSSTP
jgi:hypothetical protein